MLRVICLLHGQPVCVRALQLRITCQNELSFRIGEKMWTLIPEYCIKVPLVL